MASSDDLGHPDRQPGEWWKPPPRPAGQMIHSFRLSRSAKLGEEVMVVVQPDGRVDAYLSDGYTLTRLVP